MSLIASETTKIRRYPWQKPGWKILLPSVNFMESTRILQLFWRLSVKSKKKQSAIQVINMLKKVEEKTGDPVAVAKFRSLMEKKRRPADFKEIRRTRRKNWTIIRLGRSRFGCGRKFSAGKLRRRKGIQSL